MLVGGRQLEVQGPRLLGLPIAAQLGQRAPCPELKLKFKLKRLG